MEPMETIVFLVLCSAQLIKWVPKTKTNPLKDTHLVDGRVNLLQLSKRLLWHLLLKLGIGLREVFPAQDECLEVYT